MNKVIVSLLVLCVSACGWHLRGATTANDKLAMTAPLDLIIATKDDHSPLINALRQALNHYNINELTDTAANVLTLTINSEILDKRTAGVGSDALTSAYEIILRADYRISNSSGVLITPTDTSARISRTYNYNVNNANSAAQEEELVLREMRRELAHTILRRAKNLSVKSLPEPAAN